MAVSCSYIIYLDFYKSYFFSFKPTTHNKTKIFSKSKTLPGAPQEWHLPKPIILCNFSNFRGFCISFDLDLSFLASTMMNGFSWPKKKSWLVPLIDLIDLLLINPTSHLPTWNFILIFKKVKKKKGHMRLLYLQYFKNVIKFVCFFFTSSPPQKKLLFGMFEGLNVLLCFFNSPGKFKAVACLHILWTFLNISYKQPNLHMWPNTAKLDMFGQGWNGETVK